MALTVPSIVGKAAEEAKNILGAVPGLAAEGAAQYVKQGTPSGVIPNVGVALARQACRRWAQQPGLVPDAVDAGFERVCRPYLDDIGYGKGPVLDLPFRGGQCPVKYIVDYTIDAGGTNPSTGTVLAVGPIVGLIEVPQGNGSTRVFLRANSGIVFGGKCFNILNPTGLQNSLLGGYTPAGGGTSRINSLTPCGADNCGNPPITVTPPTPPPGPVINIDPIVVVPILDIDAGLTINVDGSIAITVDGVEVTIDPFGGGGDGGGGVDGGDLVPDGGAPGGAADTGNGGTAAGEAPPGQELVGVRVEVLESPVNVNTYDRVAVTVFRGIGYVRMGYPGRLALDMGGAAVISPQFFLAPVRGLTNWEVRANNGFINRVTPFYRELPP